jgi:hypothetical protein
LLEPQNAVKLRATKKPLNVLSFGGLIGWQGKKDSNLRMSESKSDALTNLATPLLRLRILYVYFRLGKHFLKLFSLAVYLA